MARTPKPLPVARNGDGSASYVTVPGDVLDKLAWRFYGRSSGNVERVLAANPGLSDRGLILPPGINIWFPPPAAQRPRSLVRLFD